MLRKACKPFKHKFFKVASARDRETWICATCGLVEIRPK